MHANRRKKFTGLLIIMPGGRGTSYAIRESTLGLAWNLDLRRRPKKLPLLPRALLSTSIAALSPFSPITRLARCHILFPVHAIP